MAERNCGNDAAAYALGALEPAEAASFARHLETCAVCRDEVAAFALVVDTLPLSAPHHEASRALSEPFFDADTDLFAQIEASVKDGGIRMTYQWTVEIEGKERPACVAETMSIAYAKT